MMGVLRGHLAQQLRAAAAARQASPVLPVALTLAANLLHPEGAPTARSPAQEWRDMAEQLAGRLCTMGAAAGPCRGCVTDAAEHIAPFFPVPEGGEQ